MTAQAEPPALPLDERQQPDAPVPPPDIAAGMARIQQIYYDALLSIADDVDPATGTFWPRGDASTQSHLC